MPNLFEQFAVLTPDLTLEDRELKADFYEALGRDYNEFRDHVLVSAHHFDSDWPTWEKHPAGDELVLLLAGSAELVLLEAGDERVVPLADTGAYVRVPADTWHTARVGESAHMLFITPGEGTLNAATPA